MTTQYVSFTVSNDRQIEPNVVAENIFSYNAENLSANSKAMVCVDCSMEDARIIILKRGFARRSLHIGCPMSFFLALHSASLVIC